MIIKMLEADYRNKSLEQLIRVRNRIIRTLRRYERTHVFKQETIANPEGVYVYATPGPDVEYYVNNENLIMITGLIEQKLKEKQQNITL